MHISQAPDGIKKVSFEGDLSIYFEQGGFTVAFLNQTGEGRSTRSAQIRQVSDIRILRDETILEIYLNHGEQVYATRYYPENLEKNRMCIHGEGVKVALWEMNVTQK